MLLGGGLVPVAWGADVPAAAPESLDGFLSGLEAAGILVDRAAAIGGGVTGILRAIDPEVSLSETLPPGPAPLAGGKAASVVLAVEVWPENLAYLKVSGLEPGCAEELLAHLKSLSGRWGLLLDVRGARGQDLDSACVLAGLTRRLHDPLFWVTDQRGTVLATKAVTGTYTRLPLLLILVDEGTAGAAEALVSVLKGSPGVMLVGAVTKGDPYLRNWIPLPGGRAARLATRKWVPVSGDSYEKIGIRPDVLVTALAPAGNEGLSRTNKTNRALSEKSDADRDLMMRVAGDAVLQRATDILLGLQAVGGYGRD